MTPITDLLTPVSVWAAILGGAALATLVISETTIALCNRIWGPDDE